MIFPSFHWPSLFTFQPSSKIVRDSDTWENKKCISLLSIEFSFWCWCKYRAEIQQGTEARRKLCTNTILQCLHGGTNQHLLHCSTWSWDTVVRQSREHRLGLDLGWTLCLRAGFEANRKRKEAFPLFHWSWDQPEVIWAYPICATGTETVDAVPIHELKLLNQKSYNLTPTLFFLRQSDYLLF